VGTAETSGAEVTTRAGVLLGLVLAACGDDDPPPRTTTACGPETNLYLADITRKTDLVSITVGSRDLGLAKGENEIFIDVHDAGGRPLPDVSLSAVPRMPVSGLRSPKTPRVKLAERSIARFEMSRIYLPTPGLWDIALTVRSTTLPPQDLAFSFCVPE
jgi:hypothetical protein